ncbi:MAG: helix-turn-helix domain-containing protein [Alphaproteobacteria bacterium]
MSEDLAHTPKHLGAVIQRQRREKSFTQGELGERAGLRQETISNIERGENARLESPVAVLAALDLELTLRPRSRAEPSDIADMF